MAEHNFKEKQFLNLPKKFHETPETKMTTAANNANATDEMGKLLLSGWVMLQDSCPQCNYPLFAKSKDRSVLKCVNCKDPFAEKDTKRQSSSKESSIESTESVTLSDKIKDLVKELESTKTDSYNIDFQIKLTTLILNCIQIKTSV